MDTSKSKVFDILDGPDTLLLVNAFRYAFVPSLYPVEFKIAVGYTTRDDVAGFAYFPMDADSFQILGIEHEDGSGHSFNLHGTCKASLILTGRDKKSRRFKAYYNTVSRKGTISFDG